MIFRKRKLKQKKQVEELKDTRINILRAAGIAACESGLTPDNLNVYMYTATGNELSPMVTDVCLEEAFSSCLSKRFPSYSMCKSTNKIIISDKDLSKFTNNSTEFINELSKTFSISEEKATFKILEHFQKHDVFVRPTGISWFVHRTQLLAAGPGSACHTMLATASSHMTSLTGLELLSANPVLLITIPTTGALFFAGAERVFAGTLIGKGCGVLRDGCLLPLALGQTIYNKILILPAFGLLNVTVPPLNLTSYLKFGEGIKNADSPAFRKLIGEMAGNLVSRVLKGN